MNKADAVDSLYSQREKLIIFGLTGRTGSGCTTVASILSKESMEELDLRSYKTCDFKNADERKYSVVYRYMKEGRKWRHFNVIEASSVILSFVLESNYGRLFDYIDEIGKEATINAKDELKKRIYYTFSNKPQGFDENKIRNQIISRKAVDMQKKCSSPKKIKNSEEAKKVVDYYTSEIRIIKNRLNKELENVIIEKESAKKEKKERIIYNFYVFFMQTIANNLRASGEFDNDDAIPGKEVVIAERINKIIGLINRYEELSPTNSEKTRVCIDALRNSAEILYFRDRYRAFYSVAVNTENEDRRNRLKISKKEIESLDDIEYPDDNTVFYHQNIQSCIQISDIYIYNPDESDKKLYYLSEQILKYVALILHPGLVAPTHIERCMQLAFNAKYNSGCLSRQVGAVVTGNDYSVRAVGWNDVPKGQVPCNLRCVEDYCRNKDAETFSEFELNSTQFDELLHKTNRYINSDVKEKMKGRYFSYCFKDAYNGLTNKANQVFTRALHAEENAFLQIAKYGGAEIQGGKLFSTASPCELCSKKAYQLGIKEIYYIDPYPGIAREHILKFGKENNPKMILFNGAIGNAYISLYSPIISYKDEMELVTSINIKDVGKEIFELHKDD